MRSDGRGDRTAGRCVRRHGWAWAWVGVAAVAAVAIGAPPRAAGLVVSSASLKAHRGSGGGSGSFDVRALLTAQDVGSELVPHLMAGLVTVTVRDGAAFDATVAISNCRTRRGGRVLCRDGISQVRAWLDPAEPPYLHTLRIRARRLAATVAGTAAPAAPITVTVQRPQPAARIGTVATCEPVGTGRLRCAGGRRPNVVFIVTDDQRWDTLSAMPTVQALAAEGVRFTNAFAPTPICAPSRASMLTGLYARNTGVLTNDRPDGGAVRFVGTDTSTLATWLQDAGYTTGMFGKYMVGYFRQCPPNAANAYLPPGWDDWQVFRNQAYYNYDLVENGAMASYGATAADYSTDLVAARAVQFIERANGQPFFVHVGTAAPHSDLLDAPPPAPRHAGMYDGFPAWRPPAYDEPEFADKPVWMQSLPRAMDLFSFVFTYETWVDVFRRAQLTSLAAVDEAVADIAAALEATGEADNTVIVFTSDNGYLWGEHRAFTKKSFAFDESIRIPLVVRLPPGASPPRDETGLALNIDIAPTLAELAGVTPGTPVDGRSLVPLLRNQQPSWRSEVLLEFYSSPDSGVPTYVGVRTAEWKYVEYPTEEEFELYDLANDPGELTNLASDPVHAATRADLTARLAALNADL